MGRRNYSPDDKAYAVALAKKIGTVKAAKQLGISPATVYDWIKRKEASMTIVPKPEKPKQEPVRQKPPKQEISIQENPEPREYLRGQIYFILDSPTVGSEQHGGRPAVIVSNNVLNKNLKTVEIVYLTTKLTHIGSANVVIQSSGRPSRVIGTSVTTIDKSRIDNYINECTPDEMKMIDNCLMSSLSLEKYGSSQIADGMIATRITEIKAERDAYADMYIRLLERFIQECRNK